MKNNKEVEYSDCEKGRIDFAKGVPEILFRGAGGRCSVPRCKNPTMGPFISEGVAVNMGTACHIFSAAVNGPRGRGGRIADFIGSAENGIWCCNYHGTLIDKARGADYSSESLFSWKNLAEAGVRKQMDDVPSPLGWVDTIEFTEFSRRVGLPRIVLSRNTLIMGRNGSGKSALMEIAASINNAAFGDRFFGSKICNDDGTVESAEFRGHITYSTVDSHSKKIDVAIVDDALTRADGGVPCILPPGDIEIIFASDRHCRRLDVEDDVDYLMRFLDVDRAALFSLAKIGTKTIMPGDLEFSQGVHFDEEDNATPKLKKNGNPYMELRFKKNGKQRKASFSGLSGSEKIRLIVDLFISKAREVCKQRLTLLMIDDIISGFDDSNFSNLLENLSLEDFQSLVMLPPGQYNNQVEKVESLHQLKKIAYLDPWRLVVINSLD